MSLTRRTAVGRLFAVPWLTSMVGCSTLAQSASLTDTYRATADRLIAAALADDAGYADLTYLCDRIGHRLSGSASLERAVAWSEELMKRKGLANVRRLPVTVPHWVRGAESGEILAPVAKRLHLLGLGMSVGTPAGGISAPVVVVSSLDELKALDRSRVEGRIVVFNAPYESYGKTVAVRGLGPSRAAALGAVGALVRSITPLGVQLPHTGALSYADGVPKIPAAAISPEDAMLLARLSVDGTPVRVRFEMGAQRLPDAQSANVIGEIVGSTQPDEVMLLGGHLDSWDVGQGAQDDGSGVMATLAAVNLIRELGLKPRRTIRVVFWTNEENGGAGGRAYRQFVGDAVDRHVGAIEMDGGAEAPVGFSYGFSSRRPAGSPPLPADVLAAEQRSFEWLRQIAVLLKPVGADTIREGASGADIAPLMNAGVPGLGELTTMTHYFDWHHTEADTLDKVDKTEFRKNVASLAVMAFVLADMPQRLAGYRAP